MTIRHIIMALETIILFLFIAPFPVLNAGNLLGITASTAFLIVTCKWETFKEFIFYIWSHNLGKVFLIFSGIIIIAAMLYFTYLSILMYKAQKNVPKEPTVIVVLGCKVKGDRPTRMLRRRLDAAYEALQMYPNVLCIVSGGKGGDEIISEAEAMKNYLIEKGVDEKRIIMEDRSSSTYENIKFSLNKMDELGLKHDITIVTDGFHEYRASIIAKKLGINSVTAYSAHTEPRYVFAYWVREWLGITKIFITGK